MIIRRLANAIRRQDWFTVLIEFALVVAGVLVALQVDNWNQARADRAKEAAFVERLAVDVDRARAQMTEFVAARQERLQSIARVESMDFGDAELTTLTEWECTQFASMHVITHPPVAVPSITEAFTGGRIDLLSDDRLIQGLIAVEQSEDRLRTIIDSLALDRIDLSQKHPGTVSWARVTELNDNLGSIFPTDGYRVAARCHFLENRPDPQFINDVARGLQTTQWYVTFLRRHLEQLDALAAVLDGEPVSGDKTLEDEQ